MAARQAAASVRPLARGGVLAKGGFQGAKGRRQWAERNGSSGVWPLALASARLTGSFLLAGAGVAAVRASPGRLRPLATVGGRSDRRGRRDRVAVTGARRRGGRGHVLERPLHRLQGLPGHLVGEFLER